MMDGPYREYESDFLESSSLETVQLNLGTEILFHRRLVSFQFLRMQVLRLKTLDIIPVEFDSGTIDLPLLPNIGGSLDGIAKVNLVTTDSNYMYELNEINFFLANSLDNTLLLADNNLALALSLDLKKYILDNEQLYDYLDFCNHINEVKTNIYKWFDKGISLYQERYTQELGPFLNSDENVVDAINRVVKNSLTHLNKDFDIHDFEGIKERIIECGIIYQAVVSAVIKWPKMFEKYSELFKFRLSHSDLFNKEFEEFLNGQNLFNNMPMIEVFNYFNDLLSYKKNDDSFLIDKQNLLNFLNRTFLGKSDIAKAKINNDKAQNSAIVFFFYQYYLICTNGCKYEPTHNCREKYENLLSHNFENFDVGIVHNNFNKEPGQKRKLNK